MPEPDGTQFGLIKSVVGVTEELLAAIPAEEREKVDLQVGDVLVSLYSGQTLTFRSFRATPEQRDALREAIDDGHLQPPSTPESVIMHHVALELERRWPDLVSPKQRDAS